MDLKYYACRIENPNKKIEQFMKYMPEGFDGTIWIQPYIIKEQDPLRVCNWEG